MRLLSIVVRLSNISLGVGERLRPSGPRWIPFLPDNSGETGALIVDCNTLATQRGGGGGGGEGRPRALEILHLTSHLWIRKGLGSEKFAGPLRRAFRFSWVGDERLAFIRCEASLPVGLGCSDHSGPSP